MGSLSKFFTDYSDLLAEAFDLDEDSNLVEKDHISAAAVENLVHNLLVNEMQEILTELIVPAPNDDRRGYRRLAQTQASNPDQGQWHELPSDILAARGAAGGGGGAGGGAGQAGHAGHGHGQAGGQPAQQYQAGVGGSIPTQMVSILKGRGWSDAAIRGALANAMAEGGLTQTWQQSGVVSGGKRENSFGPWQFNARGELPGYLDFAKQNNIANPQGDIGAMTNYMASRVEKMMPNYSKHTDDKAAVDDFHINFERPANKTPGTRYQHLGAAQQHFDTASKNIASGNTGTSTGTGEAMAGSGANLVYSNQNATRRYQVTGNLENKLKDAAEQVYGPGAKVVVYSGGQDHIHRTGSTRHNIDAEGRGQAADVRFYHPDGKQVTGDDLGRVGQYWAAKNHGGVGMTMAGGGVHLDQHTDRARSWSYGGETTPAQLAAVERGKRGELPTLFARPTPSTQTAQNTIPSSTSTTPGSPQDELAKIVEPQKVAAASPVPTSAPTSPISSSDDDLAKIVAPQKVAAAQPAPARSPAPPPKAVPPPVQTTDEIAKIVAPQVAAVKPAPVSPIPPPKAVPPPVQTTDELAKIVAPQVAAVQARPPSTTMPPVTPPPVMDKTNIIASAEPFIRKRLGIQLLRS